VETSLIISLASGRVSRSHIAITTSPDRINPQNYGYEEEEHNYRMSTLQKAPGKGTLLLFQHQD
jgi:hypothetical protein